MPAATPAPPQPLSVTSAPVTPAATLTSRIATFTPLGLTTFLLRWFPRKRLVKHCTMRFRGNAMGATAITIRADALSAACECAGANAKYGRVHSP